VSGHFELAFVSIFHTGQDGLETMGTLHELQPLVAMPAIAARMAAPDEGSAPDLPAIGYDADPSKPCMPAAMRRTAAGYFFTAAKPSDVQSGRDVASRR
jgi:hypothetical protein